MAQIAAIAAVVSAIGTIAAAGLQIMQSRQQSGAMQSQSVLLDRQARQQEVQARQQELVATTIEQRGEVEALDTRQQLLRVLSAQNARYAASGLVLEEGTPRAVEDATREDAERELRLARFNTQAEADAARMGAQATRFGAAGTQQRARLLRADAGWTATSGLLGAGITLLEGAGRTLNRWPGATRAPTSGAR